MITETLLRDDPKTGVERMLPRFCFSILDVDIPNSDQLLSHSFAKDDVISFSL